jgi:hypothetical protein
MLDIFAAIEDAKCQIRPDKDQIENSLKLAFGNSGLDTELFTIDENVKWMCKMMWFSGHWLTPLMLDDQTKTTFLFCKEVSGNNNCRGFWMMNNYSMSKSKKITLCLDCQIYEWNAMEQQEWRDVDKGACYPMLKVVAQQKSEAQNKAPAKKSVVKKAVSAKMVGAKK